MMLETFLNEAVLYIYRLFTDEIARYAVFMAMIFCGLHRRYAGKRWWRAVLLFALGAWCSAVLWVTVFSRDRGMHSAVWIPFHTYYRVICGESPELLRSAFMNMVLFYPAGMICAGLLSRNQSCKYRILCALLCFGVFSLSVELTQYFRQLGNCEIDDVLHNTLGAAVGVIAFCRFENGTG